MTSIQPEWPAVGDQVAVYTWRDNRVSIRIVSRLTATQVVLNDGSRYQRKTLNAIGDGQSQLRKVDDPSVRDSLAVADLDRLRFELDGLFRQSVKGLDQALSVLDHAGALVAAAHKQLATPTATPTAE